MVGQMAIAIVLPGFNDLGRSVIPIFFFLYRCSFFSENMKKIHRPEVQLNFLQNAPSNSVLLALCLSVRQFQMSLSFVETVVTFGVMYAPTDPLLQNKTNIVCLRCLTRYF